MNLSPTVEDVRAVLGMQQPLVIDIETPRDNATFIKMVGLCYEPDKALVFPWLPEFVPVFREAMARQGVKVGHNFIGFDYRAFIANGIEFAPWMKDTIQMESLIRPAFRGSNKLLWSALSTCLAYHLDDWPYHKDPENPFTKAMYRAMLPDVPEHLYEEAYCGLDCISNRRLFDKQEARMKHDGTNVLFEKIIVPNAPVLTRMEDRGVKINVPLRDQMMKETEARLKELKVGIREVANVYHTKRREYFVAAVSSGEESAAQIKRLAPLSPCEDHPEYTGFHKRGKCVGCAAIYAKSGEKRIALNSVRDKIRRARAALKALGDEFNVTSPLQWTTLLFDKDLGLGLPVISETPTGRPQVNDSTIEELQKLYPDVEILAMRVEFQHLNRRKTIILEMPLDEAGKAHFAFSFHRTATGRSSSGDDGEEAEKYRESAGGNMQNWRDADRRLVIPSREDQMFAEADYEQMELRVQAWRSGDRGLIKALLDGVDVYSRSAAAVFGIKAEDARKTMIKLGTGLKPARQHTKQAVLAWGYRMGAAKTGRIFRPWEGKPVDEVVAFLMQPHCADFLQRAWRLKHYGRVPVAIKKIAGLPHERPRLYEAANTITGQKWIDAYFREWPGLRRYQEEIISRASRDGGVVNAFGRLFKVHDWRWNQHTRTPMNEEDIVAAVTQSEAGEIAKSRLLLMEKVYQDCGGGLSLFVHDSYGGDVAVNAGDEFVARAHEVLEVEWPEMGEIAGFGLFRCPASVAVGWNWGKRHVHSEGCDQPCGRSWNPDGLVAWDEFRAGLLGGSEGPVGRSGDRALGAELQA